MEAAGTPHALVLPLPGHGHINPMLSFSLQMASRGCIITFLVTEPAQDCMQPFIANPKDARLHIRFLSIPGESFANAQADAPGLQKLNALLQSIESQQAFIEDMVLLSRASPHPIICIVSDSFFPWTRPLASKLGIKHIVFWTTSGMPLASLLEIRCGKFKPSPDDGECDDTEVETGGIIFKRSQLSATLPKELNRRLATLNDLEHTACIVVNTFEELEASSLKASVCETHIRYVGPLLPPSLGTSATMSSSSNQEDNYCLRWLDKQAEGAVLYISFGSAFSLTEPQLEEVATGIEESKQPFLWVIRDGCSALGQEFLDRTSGYGLVIKWAPQVQVLNHIAVGVFLTHCGWNSVLESIHMGVPMLCYPMSRDQNINAVLIAAKWKLGVAMKKEEDGVVSRDNVKKALATLMHSQDIQKRAQKMKAASHCALEQGGSSYNALESVFRDMTCEVNDECHKTTLST